MDNNKRKCKLVEWQSIRRRAGDSDGAAATCDDVVVASRWGDCGCMRAMAVSQRCRWRASAMKARVH